MAGSYEQAKVGDPNSSAGPKWVAQFLGQNEALDTSNKTPASSLSLGNLGRWYAPVEIATEQERESATFGALTTKDEVTGVVLPTNGLIAIAYRGIFKSSVAAAGRAAVFIGATQLKTAAVGAPAVQEASTSGTAFRTMTTFPGGLITDSVESSSFVTTGQALVNSGGTGGLIYVFAAAGTYAVSVQYKATSGKVIAKERTLQVGVIGI